MAARKEEPRSERQFARIARALAESRWITGERLVVSGGSR